MAETSIGEQELALLRHIADVAAPRSRSGRALRHAPRPRALDGADDDGAPEGRGISAAGSSTAFTAIGRRASSAELLKSAVQRFVERNLDGSVAPFLAYLAEGGRLSADEIKNWKSSWHGSAPTAERTGELE